MAYLNKVNEQGVKHVELFFDPQTHTERGISFETVITGIDNAIKDANKKLGMSCYTIMCFLRHLSERSAEETLEITLYRLKISSN